MRETFYRLLAAPLLMTALLLALGLGNRAAAGEGCVHCGSACHKICRLVCEEKQVEITCWGCKCEDFCLPGHSQVDCRHCEQVCAQCNECEPSEPFAKGKNFTWKQWIPGCAQVHTKKKLMKKTVTKKVPSYKWVVENVCDECAARLEAGK